jgi:RHS repeat-associated protein
LVTNSAGSPVYSVTYDPYGKPVATTGANPGIRHGYNGEYTDPETGFQYLRARFYDPVTGTFLTRDPAVAATREAYGYVYGNPLNLVDPSGLFGIPGTDFCVDVLDDSCGSRADGRSLKDAPEAVWDHKGEIATAVAIGACIAASFGTCAVLSVAAFGVRAWDTFEEQGWEEGRGDVALDGSLTFLTLGVGGIADEGLRVAGPLTSDSGSLVFAQGSEGLEWVGRGMFGAFDVATFGAELAARTC